MLCLLYGNCNFCLGLKPPVLLFVQSIDRAKQLFIELVYDGINVDVMHAERSQLQREEVIRRFRTGDIWVLICTDLMARGIDFKGNKYNHQSIIRKKILLFNTWLMKICEIGVQMVINYDLPQSAVSYIHRIGRTGFFLSIFVCFHCVNIDSVG